MKTKDKNARLTKFFYWFVMVTFVVTIGFIVFRLVKPPSEGFLYRSRADYVLMLLQCILGVLVIHLPMVLSNKFKFRMPKTLYVLYMIFLYCAIFLGEIRNFYYIVPGWDDYLHCFSSMMTGLFGFMCIDILNREQKTKIELPPFFIAVFAFCLSVTIGAVWEIYEFLADAVLNTNMQKYMLQDSTMLLGHEAVRDTMKDIIVDTLGAFFASLTGYLSVKHKKGFIHEYLKGKQKY